MKLFKTRNFVIVGSIALVVGLILIFAGYSMSSFSKIITLDERGIRVVSNKLNDETKVLNSNIKNIKIKADSIKVQFQVGDKFSVKSSLINRRLKVRQFKDTAYISTNNIILISKFWTLSSSESILVTVPRKDLLKSINLDANSSNISIKNLNLSNLNGKLDSSRLTVENLKTQSLQLQADSTGLVFSKLTTSKASFINMDSSHSSFKQASLPGLKISGDASRLTINNKAKAFPFKQGNQAESLKIVMNSSRTTFIESLE